MNKDFVAGIFLVLMAISMLCVRQQSRSYIVVNGEVVIKNDTNDSKYNFKAGFNKSESTQSYTTVIVNESNSDVLLKDISEVNLICTGSGLEKDEDEELVCNNLSYHLTYASNQKEVQIGDVFIEGSREAVTLTLYYQGSKIPRGKVEVTGFDINMIYYGINYEIN